LVATSQTMNEPNNLFSRFSAILDKLAKSLQWLGATVLFCMMVFIFVAVVLRYLFNRPIGGDVEITQLISLAIIWLGIAWGQVQKSHIQVGIVTDRFSPDNLLVIETAMFILLLGVAGVITWQGILNTLFIIKYSKTSQYYSFPLFPLATLISIGCLFYFLVLLRDFIHNLRVIAKTSLSTTGWLLMIGAPILIITAELLFMQPMFSGLLTNGAIAGIGIVFGIIFIFFGMPIGPALAMTGFIFVGNMINPAQGFGLAGADLFRLSMDYSWSTIMLFILMSEFIIISGIGAEAFDTAYKWLGHLPGGLAIATIGACTILAAVIGIPAPAIIAMGGVALPSMRKRRYADSLAAGSIASGACLGPLIPPSVTFIFYGVFTGVPIGKLFIAGIIPGAILALGFMITTLIICRIKPVLGMAGERSKWNEKFASLKRSLPLLILIFLVLGGIYFGVFTTTEGGGIGAFLALVITFAMGRLKWKTLKDALIGAARTNAVMVFMVIGSMLFGRILTVSNLGAIMENMLADFPSSLIVIFILIFYFIIGLFVDTITVLILTLPILTPILNACGVDLLWFGVVLVMIVNLGAYTPPYGLNLFILTSTTDVKLGDVFRGVMPFIGINLLIFLIIYFFPGIATWLPNLLE
jgi:tripartite ATP-independent transporter DctM subunit